MTGWQKLWQDPEIAKRWSETPPLPEVVEMANRLEGEGRKRVLDIGCGVGRHTIYLATRGFEVTATDNAPNAIASCKDILEKAGVKAEVLELDMREMPFPDGHFDGVVSSHVIHHGRVEVIASIIGSITRKLSPRGYFVWAMPTPDHFDCGLGEEIELGTWVSEEHREGPVPHHFCTEEEVYRLLHSYEIISLRKEDHRDDGRLRSHWRLLARKL
jgi:SAM-dependent methyltransferase